jgi:lipopolysaccharide export system permease protein
MPRLSLYVLKQLIGPTALFTFLLTSVVWLTQSLRLLDLVINRDQSAPTFFYLTILILPSLLVIILPVAFFAGALYGLSRLSTDSELVVMGAAGYSKSQLTLPVMIAAAIVMVFTYVCGLYLMPAGQRAMEDKVLDIRADIGAALLNPGEFNTPAKDLTVFIRDLEADGTIKGVLVHDSRDEKHPTTYLAEHGLLAQTQAGARLIMFDGTIEQSATDGSHLSVLKFKSYVFNLDQFSGHRVTPLRATSERYLGELLWPQEAAGLTPRLRQAYLAEAHNRLSAPLYCLAFALVALAAVARGRRARGAQVLRLVSASIGVAALRIGGYAIQGLASSHPIFVALFYLVPIWAVWSRSPFSPTTTSLNSLPSRPKRNGPHELVVDAL